MNTLTLVHIASGAIALSIAVVSSLQADKPSFFHHHEALHMAFLGLLLLITTPSVSSKNKGATQTITSTLLIAAACLQALELLAPDAFPGLPPLVSISLPIAMIATLVKLFAAFKSSKTGSYNKHRKTRHNAQDALPAEGREIGTVKWFNTSKGFGFISRDQGDDIFVHFRAIRGEGHRVLVEGQRVEFSVIQRDKGLQAEDVTVSFAR
ncbi:cold shock domain-containing protein membrane protein [Pseudomonas luteola]